MRWLLLVCLCLACRARVVELPRHSTSSLALSRDGALLYAVETDSSTLAVVDVKAEEKIADIAVGAGAHLVAVAADDTIYVANRRDGSLSVIRRGEWSAAERWPAGVEPVGLALSTDERTVYVVSAVAADTPSHGTLLALDARRGDLQWELAVGHEPRGVAVLDEGYAVVTLLKEGDLSWVDLLHHEVRLATTTLYAELNREVGKATFHPRDVGAVMFDPGDQRVYALATLARESPHDEMLRCFGRLVAPPALLTLDPAGRPLVHPLGCLDNEEPRSLPETLAFPGPGFVSASGPWHSQGGVAITVPKTGAYVWIAHPQGNSVSWAFTKEGNDRFGPGWHPVLVGRHPTGILLDQQDRSVWVHNALDHTLTKIVLVGGDLDASKTIIIGSDVLDADAVAGRKLFFDSTDLRLTRGDIGVSCATCHLEGGEDGHVWRFAEGPRQTPSLAGGRLSGTAPFHWSGAFTTFEALMQHTVRRMGGTGLTPELARQLFVYLETLPASGRPNGASRIPFDRAGCAVCHAGDRLTNNSLVHAGTDEAGFSAEGINVPSLLGVARTAPYLHDGSAATLKEAVERHSSTSMLSQAELAELLKYVEQL